MKPSEIIGRLITQQPDEGDLVTQKTVFASDGKTYILVQPPNFAHAYKLSFTLTLVRIQRSEYALTDDPQEEFLPFEEFAADLGTLTQVSTKPVRKILEVKLFPDIPAAKLIYWANSVISDDIKAHFQKEIAEGWEWEKVIASVQANEQEPDDGDSPYGLHFLGTVMGCVPSGKFYMPYACSNTYPEEANVDALWQEALEAVAGSHGGWVQAGEGDPCDLFFGISVESESETPEEAAIHA